MPREQERALIVDAACRTFGELGHDGAGINRIAAVAGVSRQAVYALFSDKSALFRAAVEQAENALVEAVSGVDVLRSPEVDLESIAHRDYARLFAFVQAYPHAYSLLREAERLGDPALTRARARMIPIYAQNSRERWARSGIQSGRADIALVSMYFAMTEALVVLHSQDPGWDRDALIDLLTEFTVGGVARVLRRRPDIVDRLR